MSLVCRIFGHKRSASKAKLNFTTGVWESFCRRCNEPLVRFNRDDWRPAERVP